MLLALGFVPAAAQSVESIGEAGKWHAYSFLEDGKKVCYMSSEPEKKEGDYKVRGQVYALVTHRPALDSRDVVSVIAGYPLKPDADIVVTIDRKQKFMFFADKETAWAPDEKTDRVFLKAWDEHDHHSVVLREADEAGMDFMGFRVDSPATLKKLAADVKASGLATNLQWIEAGEVSRGDSAQPAVPTRNGEGEA